jgi:hypothetical protein
MAYRGSRPREAKFLLERSLSTPDDKFRRHRNKKRIWRRAVRRLEAALMTDVNVEAAPFGAASA